MSIPFDIQAVLPFKSDAKSRVRRTVDEARETSGMAAPPRPSILPKNYLVEFIAGTFGPASSGRGLMNHLETEEEVRRVVTRTNLGIMTAQDLEASAQRKLEEVQLTRAIKFKHAIEDIVDHIDSSANRDADRPHVIRQLFALDDGELGHEIASRMAKRRFLERLMDESYEIDDSPFSSLRRSATASHFSGVEAQFRKEFASLLPDDEDASQGTRRPIGDDKALKIINRIFDAFAPRMVLLGHSQGGLVALRTMQLGMRRVRVPDSRRFLYSPRSGRVHRYSPVALALGLGAPFDGIHESPKGFPNGGRGQLSQRNLPTYVKRFMPGAGQMLHGSPFLKRMRSAFIPFDCSALSIANPKDGVVPLESTRLPVGEFKNMHNLDVDSTNSFDLVDILPAFAQPGFSVWPMSELRSLLNDDPRLAGVREHCSFLVDLGENWDVDHGEIVKRIFTSDRGERLFDEMMYEVNFDGLREQLLANVLYRLRGASTEERRHLAWMAPHLQHMIHEEELPFLNSLDKRASLALDYITTP